jgi:hypothetical protein
MPLANNGPGRVNTKFDHYSNYVFVTCTANNISANCKGTTDQESLKKCMRDQMRECYVNRPAAMVEGIARSYTKDMLHQTVPQFHDGMKRVMKKQ